MKSITSLIKTILPAADIVLVPAVYIAALLLKLIRRVGVQRMTFCKRALMNVGVFPIRNHYYEPLFDSRLLRHPLDQVRDLPGINWNSVEQLQILKSFCFGEEIKNLPRKYVSEHVFHLDNDSFGSGDAEYLYNLIRLRKPARIFEVGSGYSTLMAMKAIKKNQEETPGYSCKHLCIEPYEKHWLEKAGVTVSRRRVEEVEKALFAELQENDLLFIDSSHMIRPQGDVLFEYLEVIPSLRAGVIVHVHDIFSPRDYKKKWIVDDVRFWNEQYLLEAFLTCNRDWKVIGALNYLHHDYFDELKRVCPSLARDSEPGSFYFQKAPQ